MKLPFSDEIRQLRGDLQRAQDAGAAAARVRAWRIQEEAARWSSDPMPAPPVEVHGLTDAEIEARLVAWLEAAAEGVSLAQRLHHLQHRQQALLQAPEWEEELAPLHDLARRRDAALALVNLHQPQVGAWRTYRSLVVDAAQRLEVPAAESTRAVLASTLRRNLSELAQRLGHGLIAPPTGEPAGLGRWCIETLARLQGDLEPLTVTVDQALAVVQDAEHQLRERLG